MVDFNQLTAEVNLDELGREGVEVKGGGGAKFKRTVPSGYYLASFNRCAALGPITSMQRQGNAKPEAKTTETIKIGFELLELVKPLNPEDTDFELIKTFKNEDGTEAKYPYTIDMNGMFNLTRSNNDKAKFPKILQRMRDALPYDVQEKAQKSHGTVAKRFPTMKSMFGQQFIIYVQEFEQGDAERNEILFTAKSAQAFSALNEAKGFPKEVQEFVEMYPHDDRCRSIGFNGCEAGTPLNSSAVLFDIDAPDMKQVNLDSVAQESIYIGANAIAGKDKIVRFCDLLKVYSTAGKYRDTAFGDLLSKGTLVIPEPEAYRKQGEAKATKEVDTNFEDSAALTEVVKATPTVKKEASIATEEAEEEYAM